MSLKLTLPTDSAERKDVPVFSGVLKYAPAALAGVARISKAGNDKHNPGQELHHARGKSNDHGDCVIRHAMDVADIEAHIKRNFDNDPEVWYKSEDAKALLTEVSQLAWRALIWSQELHERYGGAPLAPGARLPTEARRGEGAVEEATAGLSEAVSRSLAPGARLPSSASESVVKMDAQKLSDRITEATAERQDKAFKKRQESY